MSRYISTLLAASIYKFKKILHKNIYYIKKAMYIIHGEQIGCLDKSKINLNRVKKKTEKGENFFNSFKF